MKIYLLINGKNMFLKDFESKEAAQTYCTNYFDHSKKGYMFELTKDHLNNLKWGAEYFKRCLDVEEVMRDIR